MDQHFQVKLEYLKKEDFCNLTSKVNFNINRSIVALQFYFFGFCQFKENPQIVI